MKRLAVGKSRLGLSQHAGRIAQAAGGPVEVGPLVFDLDVGLIQMPLACHWAFALVALHEQNIGIFDHPMMDCGVVHRYTPLGNPLINVA